MVTEAPRSPVVPGAHAAEPPTNLPDLDGTKLSSLASDAMQRQDYSAAARFYEAAVTTGNQCAADFRKLGIARLKLGDLERAEAALRRAIELDAGDSIARHALGHTRSRQLKLEEAILSFREAIELRPDYWDAHYSLWLALAKLGRLDEAIPIVRRLLDNDPSRADIHAELIFGLDLCAGVTLAEQQRERRLWYERHARHFSRSIAPFQNSRDPDRRLRIGYVSADFRVHSAAMAFGPIIRYHDRASFEVFCYSGSAIEDVMTQSIRKAAATWRSTMAVDDDALAGQIRADGIDILVDLSGFSAGQRLPVFARKPAPIQVTAWGYATGTGLATMDYLISDPIMVPLEVRHLFAEQILDLPCCYCYEPPGDAPPVSSLPSLQGSPFTFGCINRTEKISDRAVALWARILGEVPGSRLLLKSASLKSPSVRREMLRRFGDHGLGEGRLIILGSTDVYGHLKALNDVDIALDAFPHTGGITTAETLWMGVPVVTLLGPTTPGRVSAAFLHAVGMPDWIARDEDEYVRIALEFAEDPEHLARLRQDLRRKLAATPVFDVRQYTRYVERGYRDLWRRWCRTAK
jgi:protein O-GlcNAc transferase